MTLSSPDIAKVSPRHAGQAALRRNLAPPWALLLSARRRAHVEGFDRHCWRAIVSDPTEPVHEDPKARRQGGVVVLIAAAFVLACLVSFLFVAVGFGHRG
jgi:hypothetical protein